MPKEERRKIKKAARHNLREHYLLYVMLSFILIIFGIYNTNLISKFKLDDKAKKTENLADSGMLPEEYGFSDIINDVYENKLIDGSIETENIIKGYAKNDTGSVLGRSRGVFAEILNNLTSGNYLVSIAQGLGTIFKSGTAVAIVMIIIYLIFVFFKDMLIKYVAIPVSERIALEGRIYRKVPIHRLMYLYDNRKWWNVSAVLLLERIYLFLWNFTIVGGIIKRYSYYQISYIIAENPGISARRAVKLSRKMMDGHKWECFCLELSFLGWSVLNLFTFGLLGLFYYYPYKMAAFCEYYAYVRDAAIKNGIEDYELLNDKFLFNIPDGSQLEAAYPETEKIHAAQIKTAGFRRTLSDTLGIAFMKAADEREWQKETEAAILSERLQDERKGISYPLRLSAIKNERPRRFTMETTHYIRHYSVTSLVLMFFMFSIFGWIWEVGMHLVNYGTFVNRGTMFGPWLPIYGAGGILILTVLNRFRKKPLAEFISIIVLCAAVEYLTSYILEKMNNGTRWWDYTGYLLNINGRICAEGLLVFGLGGMAVVYLIAPRIDNRLKKVRTGILLPICIALTVLFGADFCYSAYHPNMGRGVTRSNVQA